MGMHAAQPPVQLLGQTPRLAAVEGGRENDRLVDRLFGFVGNGCGGEDAGAQGAKCLATRLDAGVDRCCVVAVARDDVAEVREAIYQPLFGSKIGERSVPSNEVGSE